MNKLILVGNGFDLAHSLPTSYKHFLNHFWKNISANYKEENYKNFIMVNEKYHRILNFKKDATDFKSFEQNIKEYANHYSYYYNELDKICFTENNTNPKTIFKFNNDFFKKINEKNNIENWVDIENEYYLELKRITKLNFSHLDDNENKTERKKQVLKLNKEFEQIKYLLIRYLRENVLEKFDLEKIVSEKDFLGMYTIFKPNSSLNNNEWNEKEFKSTSDYKHIKDIYAKEAKDDLIYCESYIVNFNYTHSPWLYHLKTSYSISDLNTDINSIHGEVDAKGLEPVFGFGDEMDKDYESIENIDDNEYLRFFKSFQYFQNTCYDGILKFIDSEKFQICILGHS